MKNFGVEIFFQKNFNVIYKNSLILIFDFYILIFYEVCLSSQNQEWRSQGRQY